MKSNETETSKDKVLSITDCLSNYLIDPILLIRYDFLKLWSTVMESVNFKAINDE